MPDSPDPDRLIVVMAKEPKAGTVKTRLSPPLSPADAAELYRCFLLDKFDQMREVRAARWAIAYTPASARETFAG